MFRKNCCTLNFSYLTISFHFSLLSNYDLRQEKMPLRTKLTEMLGIEHPIIQGGMQHVGLAEMASAVSNAGGLGILTALSQPSPEALREEIRRTRKLTDKPFGVNITILPALIPADYDSYARVVAEEKVAMVELAGGSPKKFIPLFKAAGVKVLHKSATIRHALKAQKAGVDLVEVVGYGASIAGGQPGDEIDAWVMLAKATSLLDVPVIASVSLFLLLFYPILFLL